MTGNNITNMNKIDHAAHDIFDEAIYQHGEGRIETVYELWRHIDDAVTEASYELCSEDGQEEYIIDQLEEIIQGLIITSPLNFLPEATNENNGYDY